MSLRKFGRDLRDAHAVESARQPGHRHPVLGHLEPSRLEREGVESPSAGHGAGTQEQAPAAEAKA